MAFERQFERDHDVESLLGSDEGGEVAENSVAQIGIEVAPVAERWDFPGVRHRAVEEGEFPPVFVLRENPRGVGGRNVTFTQRWLQRVKIAFEVASLFAENDEARPWSSGEHGGAQQRTRPLGVVEKKIKGVVGGEAGSFDTDVRSKGEGLVEQHQGLIDEVGGEVEEHTATGCGFFTPRTRFRERAETVVSVFETNDAAEFGGRSNPAESLEIGVEAPIVVDREDAIALLGEAKDFESFGDGGGEGFIHDDVTAGFEARLGERKVRWVRRGDDHETEGVDGE